MSSINRPLAGPTLSYDLSAEVAQLRSDPMYKQSGKLGRALVKNERFRITLTVLASGETAETHHADSSMSVQVIDGALQVGLQGGDRQLGRGELLFTAPGDARDIRATEDAAVLITISAIGDDFRPTESRTGSGKNP
jgi:quercetin dioxygenase-like cupin family protein